MVARDAGREGGGVTTAGSIVAGVIRLTTARLRELKRPPRAAGAAPLSAVLRERRNMILVVLLGDWYGCHELR